MPQAKGSLLCRRPRHWAPWTRAFSAAFLVGCLVTVLVADASALSIILEPVASGFSSPVDISNAGDDRLFVVEQGGSIRIVESDGTVRPLPFLDIGDRIKSGGEQGLLGLAFHPDYASTGSSNSSPLSLAHRRSKLARIFADFCKNRDSLRSPRAATC